MDQFQRFLNGYLQITLFIPDTRKYRPEKTLKKHFSSTDKLVITVFENVLTRFSFYKQPSS